MVGLTGAKQAPVLLMAAGTNDLNSWKCSRAANNKLALQSWCTAGHRTGRSPTHDRWILAHDQRAAMSALSDLCWNGVDT